MMGVPKKKMKSLPPWIDPQTGALSFSSKKILKPLMHISEFLRSPLGSQAVLAQEDRDISTFHHLGAFAYQKGILKTFDLGKHQIVRNAFDVSASFLNNQLVQITLHPKSAAFGAMEKDKLQNLEEWLKSQAGIDWPSWNWLWGTYSLNSNYDPRWSEKIHATLDVRWGHLNHPGKPWRQTPYVLAVAVEKRPDQKWIRRFVESRRRVSLQWMTDDSDCYQALILVKCPHKQIEHFSVRIGLTSPAFLPKKKEFKKARYLVILSLSAYHCGPQFELVDEFARKLVRSYKGAVYGEEETAAKKRSASGKK
jgi:hypothetical protein